MDSKELIRRLSEKEPLNPYQIAGLMAIIDSLAIQLNENCKMRIDNFAAVMAMLDRTGAEAAEYLVQAEVSNSVVTIDRRFTPEDISQLIDLTSFPGRKDSIKENLIPLLEEIPNWLDLVIILSRYALDKNDAILGDNTDRVLPVVCAYFFAAAVQPFDKEAASDAEYSLTKLIEHIISTSTPQTQQSSVYYLMLIMDFLKNTVLSKSLNPLERRLPALFSIKTALLKTDFSTKEDLFQDLDLLFAQTLQTALTEIKSCPTILYEKLEQSLAQHPFPESEQFRQEVLLKINLCSEQEIQARRSRLSEIIENRATINEAEIRDHISFIKNLSEQWRDILVGFENLIDSLPLKIQEAFAQIVAVQILAIDKPDIKALLIQGFCNSVIRLEKTRKQASRDLVHSFAELLLNTAYTNGNHKEVVSSLKAIEALGVTLGKAGYFLMAQELIDQLVCRPLIPPAVSRYTIEDDDTGEPLVLAEDTGLNRGHVQQIKTLLAIISSNPRIMHKLMPYLIVQLEIGGTRLCDEDLIQYSISALLRSNSSITHFLVRTLIKAIPYSFKEIGPLDDLRLTAAGLAKELADRGTKPIGNFLGKLRGDIHWRGSVENFYFVLAIMRYFESDSPEYLSDYMPSESMPYLRMENWCKPDEAMGIKALTKKIFSDLDVKFSEKDGWTPLLHFNPEAYSNREDYPQFSSHIVLNVINLLQGLHKKYFIDKDTLQEGMSAKDMHRLDEVINERKELKEKFLIPDNKEPLPVAVTLTEGVDDHHQEMERVKRDQPGSPIILRAKKTGHAYAQKAVYIEERFEQFNKDLALESLQETLATSVNNMYFDRITPENLRDALIFVDQLVRGISVNGHSSYYLEQAGRDLRRADFLGLTFDKVRDIIAIIKKELDDIHSLYRMWFEAPFDGVLTSCSMERLPRKLKDLTTLKEVPESDFFKNYLKTLYLSDLQARDGNLRVLETFIDKIEFFFSLRLADSGKRVVSKTRVERETPFYFPDPEDISPCRIGLKASLLRFAENTPSYFVITTDQRLKPMSDMLEDREFRNGLKTAVERLGTIWGRSFGDPHRPALFSVRSGARISMPGMMTTITNVGINDEIAEKLAESIGPWFAYDCYRRFLQEFSQAVFGVEREEFQDLIDESKDRFRVNRKTELSAEQMKSLAFEYKKRVAELAPKVTELLDKGLFLELLIHSAVAVLYSFEGAAARKYREAAAIHGLWRTPVIIQGMVYGNMELENSGTGVVSYNPFTMDIRGDFAKCDQGTDVVDGKVPTIPVYDLWKTRDTLASQMPEAWKQLSRILFRTSEQLHFDTRLEYTIEAGKVFILQIRKDRERRERVPSLRSSGYKVIAEGTGVSGTIFRGILVTDRNQIAPFRHINKAQSIIDAMNERLPECDKLDGFIFVVNDPIPEEIMEDVFSLPVSTALISRQGGRGAHAADIAKALNKVYVGQVHEIAKFSGKPEHIKFNDENVVVGSKMLIHGQTGEIAVYGNRGTTQNCSIPTA